MIKKRRFHTERYKPGDIVFYDDAWRAVLTGKLDKSNPFFYMRMYNLRYMRIRADYGYCEFELLGSGAIFRTRFGLWKNRIIRTPDDELRQYKAIMKPIWETLNKKQHISLWDIANGFRIYTNKTA